MAGGSAVKAPLLGIFAALALAAGAVRAEGPQGCVLAKVGELTVKFQDNQLLVPVSINGKPAWFLIDTGASKTSIWGGAAKSLGLRLTSSNGVTFYGIGGGEDARIAVVSLFGLGGGSSKDVPFYVIGHTGSVDDAGILGRDVLGHFDIEFDLANKVVRLWQSRHCGDQSLAYWTKAPEGANMQYGGDEVDYFRIKVLVNGAPIDAELDSGATTSVITTEAASDAKVRKEDFAPGNRYATGIGEKPVKFQIATFDTVAIGSEQIRHARLQVSDLFAADVAPAVGSNIPQKVDLNQPSMLLGADFLRSHRVLLAPDRHMLYFTYSGGQVFQIVGEAVKTAETAADAAQTPPTAK